MTLYTGVPRSSETSGSSWLCAKIWKGVMGWSDWLIFKHSCRQKEEQFHNFREYLNTWSSFYSVWPIDCVEIFRIPFYEIVIYIFEINPRKHEDDMLYQENEKMTCFIKKTWKLYALPPQHENDMIFQRKHEIDMLWYLY